MLFLVTFNLLFVLFYCNNRQIYSKKISTSELSLGKQANIIFSGFTSRYFVFLSYAIETKWLIGGTGIRYIILLHNNVVPHTANATMEVIFSLDWEIFLHVAFSSDLTPSNYYQFRLLQHPHFWFALLIFRGSQKNIVKFFGSKSPYFF